MTPHPAGQITHFDINSRPVAQQNSPEQLEQALRDFDRTAKLVSDEGLRQVWRFEFSGKIYLVHFYPRIGGFFRKRRTSTALSEFLHLQEMQRALIPITRPVSYLAGFIIGRVKGDAVILETIENGTTLSEFRPSAAQRRQITHQIAGIIHDIGAARMTYRDLTIDSFVIGGDKVYLADAKGAGRGGFRMNDLFTFAHNASRFATRTDLLRVWNELDPHTWPPRVNPMSRRLWKQFIGRVREESSDVGTFRNGEWSGFFTKTSRHAVPWSVASRLNISRSDWESAWTILLGQLESGQLTPIKQDASGDVFNADLIVGGRPICVIVKRPKRKFRYRYFIDLFRPARTVRMWIKAWTLISRNLPCEWPMIVMRKKKFGYTTDGVIVFERVPGARLDEVALNVLDPKSREMLFHRAGRTLRAIERGGLVHYDSKSTNWIVYQDPARGPIPVMIDVDGIRPMNPWLQAWGILRLLRAMKKHPQYTPADSLALCRGFAPFARGQIQQENVSHAS